MNEKSLMRKKKAELLDILAGLGENPNLKALKKDLVKLILKTSSTPEPQSRRKPEKKIKKTFRKKRLPATAETPAPIDSDAEETVRTAQRQVEEAKYAVEPLIQPDRQETDTAGPITKPAAAQAPPGEAPPAEPQLPRKYGEDRITAMARDPEWLFVYWEITPRGLEAARSELGRKGAAAKTALRVYDVTGVDFSGQNANRSVDIEIADDAGNWYVNTNDPGRTFLIDVGLLGPAGVFCTIARSNLVATPRATASEETDERWMTPEGEFERIYDLSGGPQVGHTAAGGSLFSFGG